MPANIPSPLIVAHQWVLSGKGRPSNPSVILELLLPACVTCSLGRSRLIEVGGPLLTLMRQSGRLLLRSSAVGAKLVAVEIAKVRHIKVRCTFARSSIVTATE